MMQLGTWAYSLLVPVDSAGTWRFRWETWACLTLLRSTTEVSSSPTWRKPWLNWVTICSVSSFICTGESHILYRHADISRPVDTVTALIHFTFISFKMSPSGWQPVAADLSLFLYLSYFQSVYHKHFMQACLHYIHLFICLFLETMVAHTTISSWNICLELEFLWHIYQTRYGDTMEEVLSVG